MKKQMLLAIAFVIYPFLIVAQRDPLIVQADSSYRADSLAFPLDYSVEVKFASIKIDFEKLGPAERPVKLLFTGRHRRSRKLQINRKYIFTKNTIITLIYNKNFYKLYGAERCFEAPGSYDLHIQLIENDNIFCKSFPDKYGKIKEIEIYNNHVINPACNKVTVRRVSEF